MKFTSFVFATILGSLFYALIFFPAFLSLIGPEGDFGDLRVLYRKCLGKGNVKVGLTCN